MRVGERGTYPYFCELPDGELLLFYRYSPRHGYDNPFLGLQRTRDGGKTWTKLEKLLTFAVNMLSYENKENKDTVSLPYVS